MGGKKTALLLALFPLSFTCAGFAAAPMLTALTSEALRAGLEAAARRVARESFGQGDGAAGWAALAAREAIAASPRRPGASGRRWLDDWRRTTPPNRRAGGAPSSRYPSEAGVPGLDTATEGGVIEYEKSAFERDQATPRARETTATDEDR